MCNITNPLIITIVFVSYVMLEHTAHSAIASYVMLVIITIASYVMCSGAIQLIRLLFQVVLNSQLD